MALFQNFLDLPLLLSVFIKQTFSEMLAGKFSIMITSLPSDEDNNSSCRNDQVKGINNIYLFSHK